MERFVAVQNIERFRRLIAREPDSAHRQRLLQLLAAEEAKLEAFDHPPHAAASPEVARK